MGTSHSLDDSDAQAWIRQQIAILKHKFQETGHELDRCRQDQVGQGYFFKEVVRVGERTRDLSISFIFSFFTTLLMSHSGSPR
jgi:hypothetical protein